MTPSHRTAPRPARVRALTGLLVLPLVLLAGCSSGGESGPSAVAGPPVPAVEQFAAGTCQVAAPDVRAVGEAIPRLGDGGEVDDAVKDELREAQDRLFALSEGAEPELAPVLGELVESLGLVRIRADGNTYEAQFGEALTASYERVLETCGAAG